MNKYVLSGYRVLDCSRILVGAKCSLMCADLGAEVIKVEQRVTGDETRHWGPPFRGPDATYFMSVNRNKKSITLDLKHPEGQKIIKDLVKNHTDIFIENFVPKTCKNLELDYQTLKSLNNSLIYASVSGFPACSPDWANKTAFDLTI